MFIGTGLLMMGLDFIYALERLLGLILLLNRSMRCCPLKIRMINERFFDV
jgi:hypothetical protein